MAENVAKHVKYSPDLNGIIKFILTKMRVASFCHGRTVFTLSRLLSLREDLTSFVMLHDIKAKII